MFACFGTDQFNPWLMGIVTAANRSAVTADKISDPS